MDDKRLKFETSLTQIGKFARDRLKPEEYAELYSHIESAWSAYDAAIDEELRELTADQGTKERKVSFSLTFGFRREG